MRTSSTKLDRAKLKNIWLLRPHKGCASIVMSMSVCVSVSVCLSFRKDISGTTRAIFTNCLCMLPIAVPPPVSLRYTMYFWFCG